MPQLRFHLLVRLSHSTIPPSLAGQEDEVLPHKGVQFAYRGYDWYVHAPVCRFCRSIEKLADFEAESKLICLNTLATTVPITIIVKRTDSPLQILLVASIVARMPILEYIERE